MLQTASSISRLTLFLHPPQPTARHLPSSFFYIILRRLLSRLPAPFKNFPTRHPRNFQITSPFPSSFLKIHPPSTRTRFPVHSPSTNCAMDWASGAARNVVGERLICNWNVKKSCGFNQPVAGRKTKWTDWRRDKTARTEMINISCQKSWKDNGSRKVRHTLLSTPDINQDEISIVNKRDNYVHLFRKPTWYTCHYEYFCILEAFRISDACHRQKLQLISNFNFVFSRVCKSGTIIYRIIA